MAEVRRVAPQEWPELRALRLEALLDAPEAFWTTHAEAFARGEREWRAFAQLPVHVAVEDGRLLGMVSAYPDADAAELVHIVAVFVTAAARRRGLAARLVEAQLAWARREGFGRAALMVNVANHDARRLYERLGFSASGRRAPLHGDDQVAEMVRGL